MRTGEIQTGEMKGSQACTGHDSDRGPTATRPGTAGDDGDGTEDGGEGLIRGCGPTGRARPRKSHGPPRERRSAGAPRAGAGLLAAAHKSRISASAEVAPLGLRPVPGPRPALSGCGRACAPDGRSPRTYAVPGGCALHGCSPGPNRGPVRKPWPVPSSRRPGARPGAAGRPRGATGCRRPRPRTPLVPRSSGG